MQCNFARKPLLSYGPILGDGYKADFEDYRDVGGVKLPFTMSTSDVDVFSPATRRFTYIRLDVVVDDSVFKMPAVQK